MDETLLLPSPNWFLVTGMAVSSDGWLFYGGPSKSLCVLEPLTPDFNGIIMDHNGYRAHVFQKSHKERIVSVDVSPKWPETQCVITGSADGAVKEWLLEKLDRALTAKSLHAHSIHSAEHEEVIGVGYATPSCAITVGSYGRIVKWDLKSNIVKPYTMIFSKFKPSCMALSPHAPYHVAVGTKQGVVLVVNVADAGSIVYKVRSHDEEIQSLSWCPQPQVIVRKFLKDTEKTQPQTQSANIRMERIRQEAELEESEQLNKSGVAKTLPEDSFDETVVEEDDMFDIYTDHADDEFGHRKYKPEVITVKVKEENEEDLDFLAKCQKLKEDILRVKNEPEPSIQSLVDAFEKSGLDDDGDDSESKVSESKPKKTEFIEHRSLPNKHLLASVGKNGTLRIWSKNGKMVGNAMINNAAQKYQHQKSKQPMWASLFWYKADVLLMTDAKGQLLQCNPLEVDWKSKLHCTVVEALHRRGVYCVISNAPRVQNPPQNSQQEQAAQTQTQNETENNAENVQSLSEDKWLVWTAAQDRYITCYSMEQKKKISCFNTCGGIPYTIQACPYDARKVAFSVGDGAVRVWEADISDEDENKIKCGNVTTYWQNVQGRVLTIAWHPSKENILAYGTAESRVGILDVSGNTEKPGRVINMGIAGSVYSLSWGDRNELYACGSEDIVMQRYDKKNSEATTLPVVFEGQTWKVTSVKWFPAGLMCGSLTGAVALLDSKTYEILAINFVFKKMIHSIEWHPQFTSSSSEESQFKDLIAVSAVDKNCNIAILKYSEKEDGTKQLDTHMLLEGHKGSVFQLAWNPHIEGQLLSSAQDNTARVWDVSSGACTAIFAGHGSSVNGVAWSPWPQLGSVALSGGGDCCVRAWRPCDHPPKLYQDNRPDNSNAAKRERKKKAKLEEAEEKSKLSEESHDFDPELDGEEAELMDASNKPRISKKFLLPITTKQIGHCTPQAVRRLAEKYCNLQPRATDESESEYDMDFIKLFGTINEVNELLDLEMNNHLEKKNYDAWMMLAIFRGQIDDMIQFASKHDLLCPFLVSIAPSVSFKYWKDVTALYIAQIDRFIAQKLDHKLVEPRHFGGAVFNKVAMLLSAHDVRGAARCLAAAGRPRDAYALCRVRHMDSIAEEILWKWTHDSLSNGWPLMTTICYIVLGETYKASTTIAGMSNESESWLSLAADLAKASGQHTYAGHLEDKKEQIKINPKDEEIEQTLQQLPSRMELLLKKNENNTSNESVTDNKIQEGANVEIEMKNGTTDVDPSETKE